jgi:hypothetical protein
MSRSPKPALLSSPAVFRNLMTAEVAALDQLYIRAAFSFDTVLENGFHRLCAHSGTFVECPIHASKALAISRNLSYLTLRCERASC